jgi:uncharacterized protein involved in response to NO
MWTVLAIALVANRLLVSHGPTAKTFAALFLFAAALATLTLYTLTEWRSFARIVLVLAVGLLFLGASRSRIITAARKVMVRLKDGTRLRLKAVTKLHQDQIASVQIS